MPSIIILKVNYTKKNYEASREMQCNVYSVCCKAAISEIPFSMFHPRRKENIVVLGKAVFKGEYMSYIMEVLQRIRTLIHCTVVVPSDSGKDLQVISFFTWLWTSTAAIEWLIMSRENVNVNCK